MDAAAAPLFRALRDRGDEPFLVHGDRHVSGAALLSAIEMLGNDARNLPVALEPGDVVGLRGAHTALRVAVPLTAWSLGLCTHLLSEREPGSSIAGVLAASGARCVLECRDPGVWSLLPLRPRVEVELPAGTLLATSGSAGRPKLVAHTLEQHLASARSACDFLGLGASDRLLLSLPTWHAGGLGIVFRAILSGARLNVPAAGAALAESLTRHRPTHVSLVATQLARLLEDAGAVTALRACRGVLVGGGPVPAALRERALGLQVPLVVTYGATETASFVVASADRALVARDQCAGRPLPQRDVRVDASGEIRVGGPTLFAGYLDSGVLRPGRDETGLWATGDLGRLEDGALYVTGRKDRMFVSGGENVQPEEIEAALLALDGVDAAVVVAVEHAEFGARPVAFVAGSALEATALDAALRDVLPGYKTPDAYYRFPTDGGERLKPDLVRLTALANDPVARSGLAPP